MPAWLLGVFSSLSFLGTRVAQTSSGRGTNYESHQKVSYSLVDWVTSAVVSWEEEMEAALGEMHSRRLGVYQHPPRAGGRRGGEMGAWSYRQMGPSLQGSNTDRQVQESRRLQARTAFPRDMSW